MNSKGRGPEGFRTGVYRRSRPSRPDRTGSRGGGQMSRHLSGPRPLPSRWRPPTSRASRFPPDRPRPGRTPMTALSDPRHRPAARRHAARPHRGAGPHRHLERLRARSTSWSTRSRYGAVGATANPTIVVDVWKKDPAGNRALARTAGRGAPDRDGGRARLDDGRGVLGARRAAAAADLRALRRAQGPALDADQPDVLPERGEARRAGASTSRRSRPTSWSRSRPPRRASRPWRRRPTGACRSTAPCRFSVAQAVAAAEAVERGIERREAEGLPTETMGPVITIMVGRVEDWLQRPDRPRQHHRGPGRARPGRAWRCSSAPSRSSTTAGTGRGPWRRPSGTTSTGPSSSAASAS